MDYLEHPVNNGNTISSLKRSPMWAAIIYLVAAALWILFSDRVVANLAQDTTQVLLMETYKGWFFVVVTSLALYFLLRRQVRQIIQTMLQLQQAHTAARDGEAFYRNLFEEHPAIMLLIDPDNGAIVDANPGATAFYGWSRDELRRMNIYQINALSPEEVRAAIERASSLEKYHFNYQHRRADGSVRDIETFGGTVHRQGKKLLFSIIQDITERKQAEQALGESESSIRTIIKNSNIVIAQFDRELRYQWIYNPHPDFGASQLVGKRDDELESSDSARRLIEFKRQVIETGIGLQDELSFERSDGLHTYDFTIEPLRNAEGVIVGGTSAAFDISRGKQAESAYHASQERLQLFIDHAPAALAMFDRDMRYLAVSRRWLDDYYLVDHEIIGRSHYEVFPEIPDRWREIHQRAMAGEVLRADADHFERLDGNVQWLHWEVHPWYNSDGDVGGILIFSEDITERKNAEEALRLSEASLRESQRVANVGHWSWDTAKNQVIWSDEMKRIFGIDPEQVAGDLNQIIARTIHPEDQEKVNRANVAVLSDKKPAPLEYRLLLPDESVRTVLAIPGDRLTDEHGNILRLTGIVQDITERKRLEEENRILTDQFYQAQRIDAVGKLAGGIAHDFNNLLMPIAGYAELGTMTLPPEHPLQANFNHILAAAERAANLTRQILAFSRQQVLEVRRVDLNQVITNFHKMLSRLLREDVVLGIHLCPNLPLIMADAGQLEQVLLNLVINARDAMPDGGTLTIETGLTPLDKAYAARHSGVEPGDYVMMAVSDTGHGMDAKTRQRIFEPFFTTKTRGQGTGLGLATVFGIVTQHRGNIWVYSEPCQGTTIKVYLPVAEKQEPEPAAELAPAATAPLSGTETILVVEDDTSVRQLVVHTLLTHGFVVLEASTPDEALSISAACTEEIHLLLTDVVMPGLNGRQLYTELVGQVAAPLSGTETILVVEDDTSVRQLVVYTLQTHGFVVLEASTPAEALDISAACPEEIHLLLTDVVMPGLNGRQLYTELVGQRPGLRVLYMSGYTDNVIVHQGALDPDVAFLAKPISMQVLLQKVKEVTGMPPDESGS